MKNEVKLVLKDESGLWPEIIEQVKDVIWTETHVRVEEFGGGFRLYNSKNVFSVGYS